MRKTLTLSALAAGLLFVSKGSTQTPGHPVMLPLTPQAYPPPIMLQAPVPAMPPQPPTWHAPRVETAKLVTKVFDITEIVMQVGTKGTPLAVELRAKRLMQFIDCMVEPTSWKDVGGRGSMVFFAENCSLVVNNEPKVLAGVEAWLEKLRAPSKSKVKVSTVHVRCEADALCKLGFGDRKPNEPIVLNADQLALVRKGMVANGPFEVITAPQFHLDNGQTGFFQVGDIYKAMTSRVTPTVAPDGRTILVQMETQTSVSSAVKVVVDSKTGATANAIDSQTVKGAYAIPNGGTVLVSLRTERSDDRIMTKVPVLGDLPMLDKFFSYTHTEPRQYETFVLMTANTQSGTAEPMTAPALNTTPRTMPMPTAMPVTMPTPVTLVKGVQVVPPTVIPVADYSVHMVAAYRKACAEGRTEEARRIAIQALTADPKCFDNK